MLNLEHLIDTTVLNAVNYLWLVMAPSRRTKNRTTTFMDIIHILRCQTPGIFWVETSVPSLHKQILPNEIYETLISFKMFLKPIVIRFLYGDLRRFQELLWRHTCDKGHIQFPWSPYLIQGTNHHMLLCKHAPHLVQNKPVKLKVFF